MTAIDRIKPLFKGRAKYNTLILGILPLLFLFALAAAPEKLGEIRSFVGAPTFFICIVVGMIQDKIFDTDIIDIEMSDIPIISAAVYFLLLALFILSCYFYLNDKKNIYCKLSAFLYVIWAVFILIVILSIEYLFLYDNGLLLGALIIWSVLMMLFLASKCIENTKTIKEGIDNKNV